MPRFESREGIALFGKAADRRPGRSRLQLVLQIPAVALARPCRYGCGRGTFADGWPVRLCRGVGADAQLIHAFVSIIPIDFCQIGSIVCRVIVYSILTLHISQARIDTTLGIVRRHLLTCLIIDHQSNILGSRIGEGLSKRDGVPPAGDEGHIATEHQVRRSDCNPVGSCFEGVLLRLYHVDFHVSGDGIANAVVETEGLDAKRDVAQLGGSINLL